LAPVRGSGIRPTTDKVREAIFNIIGQDLKGLNVLDLFAGTGSLGLEALSRGAAQAVFIDGSKQAHDLVRRNLTLCGYQDRGFVIKWDLRKGLPRSHPLLKRVFDLIFVDPPYAKNLIPPLLEELTLTKLLSPGSLVIAELSKMERLWSSFGNLPMAADRLYGDTRIQIYRREDEP